MNRSIAARKIFTQPMALLLIVTMLFWAVGFPFGLGKVHAAALASLSDTISDSRPGVVSNHEIKYILSSTINASTTMVVAYSGSFQSTSSPAFAASDATDYDIGTSTTVGGAFTELTLVAAGGCPASGNARFEITSVSVSTFTFTHCNGTAQISTSTAVRIRIGSNAVTGGTGDSQLVNPVAGSYRSTITAPSTDASDFRVAILSAVTVTASVDTTLTFTVSGKTSGTVNGEATACDSNATATALPYGTLVANTPKVMCQLLNVTTNATNGFAVTVQENQALTSASGAIIDDFKDGAGTFTPTAWTSPTATIGNLLTYGHFGMTSSDTSIPSSYASGQYSAVASSTPRNIFDNAGPADGTTTNVGSTTVAYKIEVSSLQEAAIDYTNRLMYIATPTF